MVILNRKLLFKKIRQLYTETFARYRVAYPVGSGINKRNTGNLPKQAVFREIIIGIKGYYFKAGGKNMLIAGIDNLKGGICVIFILLQALFLG